MLSANHSELTQQPAYGHDRPVSISAVEVSVRGVRSPVLTAGPPDGAEAVVFVHGNLARPMTGATSWPAQANSAGPSRRTCPATAAPASPRTSATR